MEKTKKTKAHKVKSGKKREIDLLLMLKSVWKKRVLVILITIAVGALTFIGTKLLITPTYRSSFTALVNNNTDKISSLTNQDILASQALTRTYSEIITSRHVLNAAAEEAGMKKNYSKTKSMVSTTISNETEIITVNVVTTSAEDSYNLAKAVADNALKYTKKVVSGSSMEIIDEPEKPTGRYRPNYVQLTILGALAGFVVTVLIICIRQFFNDRIQNEGDLEEHYTIPIVGVIPDMVNVSKGKGEEYYYYYRSPDEVNETVNNEEGEGK